MFERPDRGGPADRHGRFRPGRLLGQSLLGLGRQIPGYRLLGHRACVRCAGSGEGRLRTARLRPRFGRASAHGPLRRFGRSGRNRGSRGDRRPAIPDRHRSSAALRTASPALRECRHAGIAPFRNECRFELFRRFPLFLLSGRQGSGRGYNRYGRQRGSLRRLCSG